MLKIWLETPFEGGRHSRRLEKIAELERTWGRTPHRDEHALTSTPSRPRPSRLPRQSRNRTPHQEHHPLERHGDGRAKANKRFENDGVGGHISTFASSPPRCMKWLQSLFPRPWRRWLRRRPDLFSRSRLARHVFASVPRRAADRREPRSLPPRTRNPAALVVSASLADARFLGIPHGLDGPRPDHGDLSGAVQSIPADRGIKSITNQTQRSGPSWATANATSPNRSAPSRSRAANNSTI
jgi:hypothetical protein